MECALARRTVTEERHCDDLLAAQLLPPGQPGGVGHVCRDRDADRRDVPVGRAPPAGRMPAPPLENRLCGHAAHEPDRALTIRRKDPVVVAERERRAGLNRLVAPGDRVGADASLALVHDGTLVEGAQQHHAAVQLEELALCQARGVPQGVDGGHASRKLPEAATPARKPHRALPRKRRCRSRRGPRRLLEPAAAGRTGPGSDRDRARSSPSRRSRSRARSTRG